MKTCHRCKENYTNHCVLRVKLDTINFDSDSYLKNRLKSNFGVCDVQLDYFDGYLVVTFNSRYISREQIIKALQSKGFVLRRNFLSQIEQFIFYNSDIIRLIVCGVMVIVSWSMRLSFENSYKLPGFRVDNDTVVGISYVLINGIILVIAVFPFLRKLIIAIKNGFLNVDVLMFVAISGAVFTGYWLEAATFSLVAVFVSAFEKIISTLTWHEYFNGTIANAKNAYVIEGNSSRKIPVNELIPGQLISVKRGMLIPVDGIIDSGSGFIDERSITGEGIVPVKKRGDKVYAGTLLESGSINVKTVEVGHETTIATIARLIQNTQYEKETEIGKFVDKCAGWLTWLVLAYSAFLFITSYLVIHNPLIFSLVYCVSIMFVACPCALLLSTPIAIHTGVGLAARYGIIFRNGHVIEKFAKTKTLLLDKTGTLTYGRPDVREVRAFNAFPKRKILKIAAALEQNSYHPLALAVCAYVISHNLEIPTSENFDEIDGGISSYVNGKKYYLGAKKMMFDQEAVFTKEIYDWLKTSEEHGYESVLIAVDRKIIGGISFIDRLRRESIDVITGMRELGMDKMIMVTGDNQACAERIAKQLGLNSFHAECFPETKLKCVREIKKNENVAMIGDGINDAPAMTAASVGIVMADAGTDAAIAAADIVLGSGDLNDLVLAYNISKKVYLTIKLNVLLSIILVIVMIALVSTGRINLTESTFLYIGSSLLVILNSYIFLFRPYQLLSSKKKK